jgi:hypothetical protein
MAKALAGFFHTRGEGESAEQALLSAGFTREQISLVAGDTRGKSTPAIGTVEETGAESEAGQDAWVGGVVGLAAGAIAVAIPGIGPLIAAGPLAGALGGLAVGAAAGGLIGLLRDHGISKEEAEFYAEGVKRGGSLILVHGIPADQTPHAKKILDEHGAIEVEKLADEQSRK